MARHELVVRDVDEQVLLDEALELGVALGDGDKLARRGGQRDARDEDPDAGVLAHDGLDEVFDLGHAHVVGGDELHEDGAAVGFGVGVFGGSGGCEFADHGVAGTGGELEQLATI